MLNIYIYICLVPVDKATGNVDIICRRSYTLTLTKSLG